MKTFYLLLILFLFPLVVYGQEGKAQNSTGNKSGQELNIRSNTRDKVLVMRGSGDKNIRLNRRKDEIKTIFATKKMVLRTNTRDQQMVMRNHKQQHLQQKRKSATLNHQKMQMQKKMQMQQRRKVQTQMNRKKRTQQQMLKRRRQQTK